MGWALEVRARVKARAGSGPWTMDAHACTPHPALPTYLPVCVWAVPGPALPDLPAQRLAGPAQRAGVFFSVSRTGLGEKPHRAENLDDLILRCRGLPACLPDHLCICLPGCSYALATYRTNQHRNLRVYTNMLAHPPFDKKMTDYLGQPFYIVHLTYPCGYDEKGNFTDRMQVGRAVCMQGGGGWGGGVVYPLEVHAHEVTACCFGLAWASCWCMHA